jgi:hypothetical protein
MTGVIRRRQWAGRIETCMWLSSAEESRGGRCAEAVRRTERQAHTRRQQDSYHKSTQPSRRPPTVTATDSAEDKPADSGAGTARRRHGREHGGRHAHLCINCLFHSLPPARVPSEIFRVGVEIYVSNSHARAPARAARVRGGREGSEGCMLHLARAGLGFCDGARQVVVVGLRPS